MCSLFSLSLFSSLKTVTPPHTPHVPAPHLASVLAWQPVLFLTCCCRVCRHSIFPRPLSMNSHTIGCGGPQTTREDNAGCCWQAEPMYTGSPGSFRDREFTGSVWVGWGCPVPGAASSDTHVFSPSFCGSGVRAGPAVQVPVGCVFICRVDGGTCLPAHAGCWQKALPRGRQN